MTSRTYSNVTYDAAKQLLKVAADNGLAVAGDDKAGTLSGYGCVVGYGYDEGGGVLTLTVERKPFLLSADFVFGKIEGYTGLKG